VRRFPGPDGLSALVAAAGFSGVTYRTFAGGIVALHTAVASQRDRQGHS
jgi:ubiquinone/menaquinone biosynthesis C-methylase UbiE